MDGEAIIETLKTAEDIDSCCRSANYYNEAQDYGLSSNEAICSRTENMKSIESYTNVKNDRQLMTDVFTYSLS